MGLNEYFKVQTGRGREKISQGREKIKKEKTSTFDPSVSEKNQPWYYIGP